MCKIFIGKTPVKYKEHGAQEGKESLKTPLQILPLRGRERKEDRLDRLSVLRKFQPGLWEVLEPKMLIRGFPNFPSTYRKNFLFPWKTILIYSSSFHEI